MPARSQNSYCTVALPGGSGVSAATVCRSSPRKLYWSACHPSDRSSSRRTCRALIEQDAVRPALGDVDVRGDGVRGVLEVDERVLVDAHAGIKRQRRAPRLSIRSSSTRPLPPPRRRLCSPWLLHFDRPRPLSCANRRWGSAKAAPSEELGPTAVKRPANRALGAALRAITRRAIRKL